jgi:undecaprenyl-diphosphatase
MWVHVLGFRGGMNIEEIHRGEKRCDKSGDGEVYSDGMEILDAILLGVVQGVTEFLPISSSGHLVLVRDWFSIDTTNGLAIDAVLHFATTAAVVIYFWSDLMVLIGSVFRKLSRLPVNQKDITLFYALAIGTVPAALLGLLLDGIISTHLQAPLIVAGVLFFASIFFMYAEWRYFLRPLRGEVTTKNGLLVGLFQALALLPGFSRSGATIAGGMLLGLSRYEATRFSFLLAIPITLGAGGKKFIDLLGTNGEVAWLPIYIGAGFAFFTAFIVIHYFLKFIRRHTLWPFVWYGVFLSALVLYVTYLT